MLSTSRAPNRPPSPLVRAMSAPTAWRATLLKALKSNGALPNAKYVQLVR